MPLERRGTIGVVGRRRKWCLPDAFLFLHQLRFTLWHSRRLLQCWRSGATMKFFKCPWLADLILVGIMGLVGKYVFCTRLLNPRLTNSTSLSCKTHIYRGRASPFAAWVQHSPALNKISSNMDCAYKRGHSVGYLAPELCLHPSCCDSSPCLFHNCMLLNLSAVPKMLNLDMERDTRDPSVYAEGNQSKMTDRTASCFAYACHVSSTGKMIAGNDQPW